MSQIGWVRELALSGQPPPLQVWLVHCRCQVVSPWCLQFAAGPIGHHEHSQLVDSPLPEGSVCLETNLAGCHSAC